MADPPLVLGIDGGGSKTLVALARADGTLAAWRSGGGTHPQDQPEWPTVLAGLIGAARPVAAVAGLAGYGESPAVSAAQEAGMAALLACPHSLHNDVQVAFDGAFQDRAGVLVLAGTGSMAWAQDGRGGQIRVGGWGAVLGDEGSGFWVGQAALTLTTQVLDGRRPDIALAEAVLAALGLAADCPHSALLDWYLSHARADIAALARCVAALAERGEAAALALMHDAAAALAAHVRTARRRMASDSPWSHAGGLFASAVLRERMTEQLGAPVQPALPPIGGALWRAARLAGWPVSAAWTRRLADSIAERAADV